MAGRPHELDDIVSRRVCNALEAGSSRTAAAAAARISMTTLMSWLARGRDGEEPFAEFLACVREAEGTAETLVTDALFKTALAGNTTAQTQWLERRRPKDWGKREVAVDDEEMRAESATSDLDAVRSVLRALESKRCA